MSFSDKIKLEVMLACKRHCCLCEKFFGTHIEIHHIKQQADGGENTFDNAIPLCFECHARVREYNPHHPKGTKYTEKELKIIRDEFYEKAKTLTRSSAPLSKKDFALLKQFKQNFTSIIEAVIKTDFTQVVPYILDALPESLQEWNSLMYQFENEELEELKCNILRLLKEINSYITLDNYRILDENYICRNESADEGKTLRDLIRPNTLSIRQQLPDLLEALYSYR